MAKKPIIGITLDEDSLQGPFAHYDLRQNYADAMAEAGAVPLMLPYHPESVAEYATLLDGLVVTGGNFDIDPSLFGAAERHESVVTKDKRTQFEWAITEAMLAQDKPFLGICGGHQLLNVILGGTLLQHIPDDIPDAMEHQQRLAGAAQGEPYHDIIIEEGTLLHRITGSLGYKNQLFASSGGGGAGQRCNCECAH